MKSIASLLTLTFITITTFGQTQFEKGYFIDKKDKKVECYIKNMEWSTNPTEISYKLDLSSKAQKAGIDNIKEFVISDKCKYINAHVKIDRSTKPSPGKNELAPVWEMDDLFLKVILEGKADLFGYNDRKVTRFFYSLNDTVISPLIYKEIYNGLTVIKNTDFRQQLWDKLRVQKATFEMIRSINYTADDLKKYFGIYNEDFGDKAMK